jgi:hypothetical protein
MVPGILMHKDTRKQFMLQFHHRLDQVLPSFKLLEARPDGYIYYQDLVEDQVLYLLPVIHPDDDAFCLDGVIGTDLEVPGRGHGGRIQGGPNGPDSWWTIEDFSRLDSVILRAITAFRKNLLPELHPDTG